MRFKTTLILLIVFGVLLAGVLFMNKKQTEKKTIEEEAKKLLNIKKEDVTELYLQPNDIHAVKDGDQWKIVSPVETDGDKSSIESIIGMFNWAKIERTVSEDTSELSMFGLQPPVAEMILVHKDGRDTVFVGEKNPTGSYVFARKGSENRTFITTTSLKSNAEKTLFDLRNKKVLGFEKDVVQSFVLKNHFGEFAVSKTGSDWNIDEPVKFKADNSKVTQLLNSVNNGRAKEFVDEDPQNLSPYGLRNPKIKIDVFIGVDKAKKSLFIGKKKDDKYYAKDDSRKPVFLVDTTFVKNLNLKLFELRNKTVAKFTVSDVDSFALLFADSIIACKKDTANEWQVILPERRKAKSWKVSNITTTVSNLRVEEFVSDHPTSLSKYGLSHPTVIAKFYKGQTLLRELSVGDKKDDQVYVKVGNEDPVYLAKESVLKSLTLKLDDLAEKKVEPKAEVENKETN